MNNAPRPRSWTVMIFMVVDDSLAPFALADIWQMQAVGSSQDVDILVQLNWKESPVEAVSRLVDRD